MLRFLAAFLMTTIAATSANAQYPYAWDDYGPYYRGNVSTFYYGVPYYRSIHPYEGYYTPYVYTPRPAVVATRTTVTTTTTVDQFWIDTWYDGPYHAFSYGGFRWEELRTTHHITPGYRCTPGYLKITRHWVDHDLGCSYIMCPCGRVFYVKTIYRW